MVRLLHYPVRLSVRGVTVMLRMRYVWALAAGCLLAPAPAHPASGQLVLSCKDEAKSRGMEGASRTSDQAFLVFDTDSGRRTRLGFLCGREAGRLVRHE